MGTLAASRRRGGEPAGVGWTDENDEDSVLMQRTATAHDMEDHDLQVALGEFLAPLLPGPRRALLRRLRDQTQLLARGAQQCLAVSSSEALSGSGSNDDFQPTRGDVLDNLYKLLLDVVQRARRPPSLLDWGDLTASCSDLEASSGREAGDLPAPDPLPHLQASTAAGPEVEDTAQALHDAFNKALMDNDPAWRHAVLREVTRQLVEKFKHQCQKLRTLLRLLSMLLPQPRPTPHDTPMNPTMARLVDLIHARVEVYLSMLAYVDVPLEEDEVLHVETVADHLRVLGLLGLDGMVFLENGHAPDLTSEEADAMDPAHEGAMQETGGTFTEDAGAPSTMPGNVERSEKPDESNNMLMTSASPKTLTTATPTRTTSRVQSAQSLNQSTASAMSCATTRASSSNLPRSGRTPTQNDAKPKPVGNEGEEMVPRSSTTSTGSSPTMPMNVSAATAGDTIRAFHGTEGSASMPLSSTNAPSGRATNLRDEATAGPDQGEGHTTGLDAGSPKKKRMKKGASSPGKQTGHHKRGGSGNDGDLRKYLS